MLSSPRPVTKSHDLAAALALGAKGILYSDIESEASHAGSKRLLPCSVNHSAGGQLSRPRTGFSYSITTWQQGPSRWFSCGRRPAARVASLSSLDLPAR